MASDYRYRGSDIVPDYPTEETIPADYNRPRHRRQNSDFSEHPSMFGDNDEHQDQKRVRYKQTENAGPGDTIIRQRKKSSRRRHSDHEYDDWTEEGSGILPSLRYQKRSRTKTFKERHQELQEQQQFEASFKPQTFRERFNDLQNNEEVSVGKLATLMRRKQEDSTLTRMKGFGNDKAVNKFKRQINEISQHFTIWLGTFKEIEGGFGTAIMTYFKFIKWLMFLNFYIMVILFGVITVPYLVLGPYTFEESMTDPNVAGYNESVTCTNEYIKYMDNYTQSESVFETVLDVLQGTGWMERRILFYGIYFNKTYTAGGEEKTYNMALAYLLAVGASFVISFLLLVKNAAKSVKVTLGIEKTLAKYSNKVFAGWDYCIKEEKGARVKISNISVDILADLKEETDKEKQRNRTTRDKLKIYSIRLAINFIVLVLLAGACYLIAFTAEKMLDLQKNQLSDIVLLIVQYVPYITITALNLILPIIFQKLVTVEQYFHEFEIKITLTRSILLRLASPIVLIAILYQQLIGKGDDDDIRQCGNNKWSSIEEGSTVRGSVKCWETYVGQQIYKLVLLDLIVETGTVLFVQTPRRLVYNRFGYNKLVKLVGPQEFHLSQNVVDIIYSQTLCWLGLFFSPLIPFMTFLKCFLFFYIRKITLIYNCQSEERPPRTSRSNSLFMTVLLLSFILAAIPIGYMISTISPSQSCGPFRSYNSSEAVMFDTISHTVNSWPPVAMDIFRFLGTAGFLVPCIIILCLLMYYYWVLGTGYKKTEKLLQEQLTMEGKDKKYLLGRLSEYRSLDIALEQEQNANHGDVFHRSKVIAGT